MSSTELAWRLKRSLPLRMNSSICSFSDTACVHTPPTAQQHHHRWTPSEMKCESKAAWGVLEVERSRRDLTLRRSEVTMPSCSFFMCSSTAALTGSSDTV